MAMAMSSRVLALFFFLLSCSYLGLSLYEDQVGLMDWHQRYIGKVKHAVFHTQKAGRKRVVVSTEENVIASLDLRHGEIFWRHVLGANDSIDEIDIALGKYVITLSSDGKIARAWNLADGQMVWESFLPGSLPSKSILFIPTNLKIGKEDFILVYSSGILYAVSSVDGEPFWKRDLVSEGFDARQLVYPRGRNVIQVLGFSSDTQFGVVEVNVNSGELLKHDKFAFPSGFSGDISFLSSDTAVALDSSREGLVSIRFSDGVISFQQAQISDLVQDFSGVAAILPYKLVEKVAVKTKKSVVFLEVTNKGSFVIVDNVDVTAVLSDSLPLSEGQQAIGLMQHEDGNIQLTVKLSSDWSSSLIKENIRIDSHRGKVQKLFLNNYIRTDRSSGFRALVVMEDHSLLLLQQGEIVWSREDGLASILEVTTSELPVEKDGVSVAKVEHSLFEWLKGHLLKLKGTLMLATPDDIGAIQKLRLQSSEKNKMTRDHNGFRKLIIVLTRAGKLFALHTGDGRIVWSVLLSSLRESETCKAPRVLNLLQWQVPHHHALDENPSIVVFGRCGSTLDAPGVYTTVDAYTGRELSSLGPFHSIAQIIPLPYTDSKEQRLHLVMDTEWRAHLYPRTTEALTIFHRELGNTYWYSVEADNGILRGHAAKGNCVLQVSDEYCFDTRNLWSIVFPPESEKIIATTNRRLNEVVHTQAKVVADQDVMYKYISKNLIFVATTTPKAVGGIGSVTPDESKLVVHLVDTITGRILHRMTHHGSQGPVHAVFSENWVVYHYFNLRAHRYEMSVIEIYDQSRADNKDVLKLVLGKHNLTSPISSYSRPEVVTKQQSYFFSHSVKAIAATSTAKGITSKQLLIGTISDQVLALDKRFLDPRRTLNPTQAEKEEGIIPLTDSLPIIPQVAFLCLLVLLLAS
ncbi:OLC1v1034391C2 [Oldenlandia corymbosa var. corymbosa]|uniref:ER membrane protein complex subunit 1 n=1 Tax=Oldenlandia corymbosa var. corymbosa TaxID=529605 RepID=A0AAV1CRT0_OLDCO|nr:OLC1v1034391C2 [Oldenlandia corymbosa var. corymbosa]